MTNKFLAPLLSAQFMTAPTGKANVRRNLDPACGFDICKIWQQGMSQSRGSIKVESSRILCAGAVAATSIKIFTNSTFVCIPSKLLIPDSQKLYPPPPPPPALSTSLIALLPFPHSKVYIQLASVFCAASSPHCTVTFRRNPSLPAMLTLMYGYVEVVGHNKVY